MLNRSTTNVLPYPLSVPLLSLKALWVHGWRLGAFSIRNNLIWEATNTLLDIYFAQVGYLRQDGNRV